MSETTPGVSGDGGASAAVTEMAPKEDLTVEQVGQEQVEGLMKEAGFDLICTAKFEQRGAGLVGPKDLLDRPTKYRQTMFFGYDGQRVMVIHKDIENNRKHSSWDGLFGHMVDKVDAKGVAGFNGARSWDGFKKNVVKGLNGPSMPRTGSITLPSQVCEVVINETQGKKDLENPKRNIVVDVVRGLEEKGVIQTVKKTE